MIWKQPSGAAAASEAQGHFSGVRMMDKLALLLAEAFKTCYKRHCTTCEFFGRNNPRSDTKNCQALQFAKYLRENGVVVKDDEANI